MGYAVDEAKRRRSRLAALVREKYGDDKSACGRALGFRDGAYIGQMISGHRPITEKFIEKHRLQAWFAGSSLPSPAPRPTTTAAESTPADLRGRHISDSEWALLQDIKSLPDEDQEELRRRVGAEAKKWREYAARVIARHGAATPVSDARVEETFPPSPRQPPKR